MKRIVVLILMACLLTSFGQAQNLADIYKAGKVTIDPEPTFKADENFFKNGDRSLRNFTNIAVAENGEIYLLNSHKYQILKFDANGKLLKTIDLNLKKSPIVYFHVEQLEILDNKYLLIRGYAFIKVYDLEGKFIKSIDFDYPIYSFVALKNNKVGIKGFVLLKNRKYKMHIAIVDIETEKEKPVIAFIKDWKKETISFNLKDGGGIFAGNPKRAPRIYLARTTDADLLVGNSKNPEILIYDIEGSLKNKIRLNYSQSKVEQQEKDEVYESFKNMIKKHNAPDSLLEVIKLPDFYYQYMPYYYGIKVDSDDNILVFKYTQDENHTFRVYQVYSKGGEFICETTLEPGDFDTPKLRLLTFAQGNLYALLKLKKDESIVKLVKAKIKPAL